LAPLHKSHTGDAGSPDRRPCYFVRLITIWGIKASRLAKLYSFHTSRCTICTIVSGESFLPSLMTRTEESLRQCAPIFAVCSQVF